MQTRPLMLDVDTGTDDAAAIALAFGLRANLIAVSTVAGNASIDLATDNSLRVLSLLGKSGVPVFRGASRPLVAPYQDAAHIHGENGLGGASLAASSVTEAEMTGPEAIITMADRHDGELTLVMVGPMTNLAIALSLRPGITRQIARLVIMGGAFFTPGNITEYAEYNVYSDPEAANQVFAAPWNEITAVGLDVTHQTTISASMWASIPEDAEGGARLFRAVAEWRFTKRHQEVFALHDPLAVAVALDPSLVSGRRCTVSVSTSGDTRGQTHVLDGGNVLVATEVKAETFVRRFCDALGLPIEG